MLRNWQKYLVGIDVSCNDELLGKEENPDEEIEQKEQENIKEIAPASSKTTEEMHGGDEATKDVENSPNPADGGKQEQQKNQSSGGGSQEKSENSSDKKDNNSEEKKSNSGKENEIEPEQKVRRKIRERKPRNKKSVRRNSKPAGKSNSGSDGHNSEINNEQVVELDKEIERLSRRRISQNFATIISKVAEDLEGLPVPGDDEWNVQALMERTINSARPLSSCRQSREKMSVVVILDTSGSCYNQAKFYANIARASADRDDVELYEAPNAKIVSRYDKKHGWQYEEKAWGFKNRTIIFFGDFDGGNAPVIASQKNKLYWFSSEDRYHDMDEHDWCSFTLKDFKGKYFKCTNNLDFIKLAKKVR